MRIMEASLKDIFNRAVALATAFILTLTLSSCGKGKSEQSHTDSVFSSPEQNNADRYSFVYPEKPAEKLRDALKSAITERSLPIDVGEVKQITFEGMEQAEIILRFTESDDNICNITFDLKHAASGFDYSLDGHDSPSFVMAFKDPGRTQDMLVVLALVLQYISPVLTMRKHADLPKIRTAQSQLMAILSHWTSTDIKSCRGIRIPMCLPAHRNLNQVWAWK